MSKTLYICYFGLREPLVQTQVLPYLREINKLENIKVSLLTFEPNFKEKWTKEQISGEKRKLADEGIDWYCLPYHKRPSTLATLYDILNGARFAVNLSRKEKIDVIHARAHVPMLMALIAAKFTKSRIVFDIRGLMAEEYVDSGIWRENSKPYRFVKFIERKGVEKASKIVVLTTRFRDYLVEKGLKKIEDIEVIPCCVDFSRLPQENNAKQRNRFELIYAGSVTGLYLLREMGDFFLELKRRKPNVFFRILTSSAPQFVQQTFQKMGINTDDYSVAKIPPEEVLKSIKKADVGISFRKPTFSQIAASPTKIPEYLACGLPIVVNEGIGDTTEFTEKDKTGVVIRDFSIKSYQAALAELELLLENKRDLAERCETSARERFDLVNIGGAKYRRIYEEIVVKDQ